MRRSSRTQHEVDAFYDAHVQTERALTEDDPTRTPIPDDELRRRAEHDHALWRSRTHWRRWDRLLDALKRG